MIGMCRKRGNPIMQDAPEYCGYGDCPSRHLGQTLKRVHGVHSMRCKS